MALGIIAWLVTEWLTASLFVLVGYVAACAVVVEIWARAVARRRDR